MSHYPEVVEKIVEDYLQRVAIQLKRFPKSDQEEVLKELSSHIYESYCAGSDPDPVGRILEVLRKLGEPADVVAERLHESLLNVGKLKKVPLSVLGGIVVGMFGLPLGFAGVAILLGGRGPAGIGGCIFRDSDPVARHWRCRHGIGTAQNAQSRPLGPSGGAGFHSIPRAYRPVF